MNKGGLIVPVNSDANDQVKQAVIANIGVAVVSKIAITDEVGQGGLVVLPMQYISLWCKFSLIYHQQKFSTKAMQAFCDSSLEILKSRP